MSLNIHYQAILRSAATRLEELIDACKVRGAVYGIDPELTRDVLRKAKGLHTSLGKLQAAVDDPGHRPGRQPEKLLPAQGLSVRLYQDPCMYELARFLSYGGRTHEQLTEFRRGHKERYAERADLALRQIALVEAGMNLWVLRPEARKACRVLLGPPPESEEYQDYWRRQGCPPPPEHQAPNDEHDSGARRGWAR